MNLGELILSRKGSRSYERLARDCGGDLTATRLHQLATAHMRRFPGPDMMTNLARGLSVSPREVVLAAARTVGMDLPSGYDTDSMTLAGVATLPSSAREAIANVAREMVRLHETQRAGEGSGQQPAAKIQAREDTGRTTETEIATESRPWSPLTAGQWDEVAADLRRRGLADRTIVAQLGVRPVDTHAGEVHGVSSGDVAGHTGESRRTQRGA